MTRAEHDFLMTLVPFREGHRRRERAEGGSR